MSGESAPVDASIAGAVPGVEPPGQSVAVGQALAGGLARRFCSTCSEARMCQARHEIGRSRCLVV